VRQRDKVVEALKKGQRPDGGFGKENARTSDLETVYRVMRAFVMLKEKPNDVAALQAFMDKCQNADGGYGVAPGQPSSLSATYFAAITQHWLANARP
jgi:prenyltransferase beta subunit